MDLKPKLYGFEGDISSIARLIRDPEKWSGRVSVASTIAASAVEKHMNQLDRGPWAMKRDDYSDFLINVTVGTMIGCVSDANAAVEFASGAMAKAGWTADERFDKEAKKSPLLLGFEEFSDNFRDGLELFVAIASSFFEELSDSDEECTCSECQAKRDGAKAEEDRARAQTKVPVYGKQKCVLIDHDQNETTMEVPTRDGEPPDHFDLERLCVGGGESEVSTVSYGITKEFIDDKQVYRPIHGGACH